MADATTSSNSGPLERSILFSGSDDSSMRRSGPTEVHENLPISPLPFLLGHFYSPWNADFLKFLPGSFRRQGVVLGSGASYNVEKHVVADIGLNMIDDLVNAERLARKRPVIAIKRLRNEAYVPWKTFEEIERELIILKVLRNASNIVQLIGLGWEVTPVNGDTRLWPILVLEYAKNGSLQQLQSSRSEGPLAIGVKKRLCVDVATGLKSLHSLGLAHGDLKSENVLVFGTSPDNYVAKLSDFGYVPLKYRLSADPNADEGIWQPGNTEVWAAPESNSPSSHSGFAARDVYSWGLLCLRVMIDGENPFQRTYKMQRSTTDDSEDFKLYIRNIKSSDTNSIKAWIESCFKGTRIASDVKGESIVLSSIISACICRDESKRDFTLALLGLGGGDASVRQVAHRFELMNEIWCSINTPAVRSLPTRVAAQVLSDLAAVEKARGKMKISLHSYPAFLAGRMVLAESTDKHELENAACEIEQQRRRLIGVPGYPRLITPLELLPDRAPTLSEREASGARHVITKGNKLSLGSCDQMTPRMVYTNAKTFWEEETMSTHPGSVQNATRFRPSLKDLGPNFGVNGCDVNGERYLLTACRAGELDDVLWLLEQGASAAWEDGEEDSPLHWLTSFRTCEMPVIAKCLIRAGGRLDCQTTAKYWEWESSEIATFASGTPLHRAVSRNDLDAVICLCTLDSSLIDKPSKYPPYHTPLTLAVSLHLGDGTGCYSSLMPDSSVLRFLVESSPEYRPHRTYSGLQRLPAFLLYSSPLQVGQLLGFNNVTHAMQGTLDLLARIGENFKSAAFSLMHLAVAKGMDEIVEYLLKKFQSMDIDLTFKTGSGVFWHPPLYYSVQNDRRYCFELLLKHGADPHRRFQTPYLRGDSQLPLEAGLVLREKVQGLMNSKKLRGPRSSYLHACVGNGSGTLYASKLLAQGLQVNTYDSNWESPLFLATIACDFDLADFLISKGASTEMLSDDRTMLGHMAEDGFMAPYAAYDYMLKAQARHGPRGAAGFMAVYGEYRTWLHVLVSHWDTIRNASWADALLDLFLMRLPMRKALDIQTDGTADTALILAVKDINLSAVRKLLEWGADPNVPNFKDGYPCDIVMDMVHESVAKHGLTIPMFRERNTQELKLRGLLSEVAQLEEILVLLRKRGGKRALCVPPREAEERHKTSDRESQEWGRRHDELGVDLKTINKTVDSRDGPIDELCRSITGEFGLLLSEGQEGTGLEKKDRDRDCLLEAIKNQLLRYPEAAYSPRRLFRVQQYLASLASNLGCSLYLDFDHKRDAWLIELQELPRGVSAAGGSVIAPPRICSAELPIYRLLPEHLFGRITGRKADLSKLYADEPEDADVGSTQVPISKWRPVSLTRVPESARSADAGDGASSPREGSWESFRASNDFNWDNMSAIEAVRLKQLLPPFDWEIIVGPEDELAQLFFTKGGPLPDGYRVNICTLMNGNYLSMTVGIKGGPARTPFMRAVPNGHYYTEDIERRWNTVYDDETAHLTDWSRFGCRDPPKMAVQDRSASTGLSRRDLSFGHRFPISPPLSPLSERRVTTHESEDLEESISSPFQHTSATPLSTVVTGEESPLSPTSPHVQYGRTAERYKGKGKATGAAVPTSGSSPSGPRAQGESSRGGGRGCNGGELDIVAELIDLLETGRDEEGEGSDEEELDTGALAEMLDLWKPRQPNSKPKRGDTSKFGGRSTIASIPPITQSAIPTTTGSSNSASGSRSGGGGDSDLSWVRDIPLTIIVSSSQLATDPSSPARGPNVAASTVNEFVSLLSSSGRANVIVRDESQSEEEFQQVVRAMNEREREAKEEIEARGVPKGRHWWEMRRG